MISNCIPECILISSDQYLFCFTQKKKRLFANGNILFAYSTMGKHDIILRSCKAFLPNLHASEDGLFHSAHCELSLLSTHEKRIAGHVYGFTAEKDLLLDVTLKPQHSNQAYSMYTASGTLLLGDEEFLFAPAHSSALIINTLTAFHNQWVATFIHHRNPAYMNITEDSRDRQIFSLYSAKQNTAISASISLNQVLSVNMNAKGNSFHCGAPQVSATYLKEPLKIDQGEIISIPQCWMVHF